ncbi:MAG: transposase [Mariprofundus sp.]
MKKHSYQQIDIAKADWISIRKKVENHAIIFSVDVAKNAFVGTIFTTDKELIITLKWRHPQHTSALVEYLCNALGVAHLEVVMEPTGTYGDVLRWQFIQRGIPVYQVNPKHTHDMAESFDGVPSNHDSKAAQIIAELHLNGRSSLWPEAPEEQRDLCGLVSELAIYQTSHQANLNRLSALLARHWPELEEVANFHTLSVLTLLREYGDPYTVATHEVEAAELLHKIGRCGLQEEECQAILASSKTSLGVPCATGERTYIQHLAADLLRTLQASAEVEKRMAQAVAGREAITEVSDLCGKTSSIVLSALFGDMSRYDNAQSLLKAFGLNLREYSSGKHKGELRISKRGPGKARFYIYWLALRLIQRDPVVKRWYNRKVARDGGRFKSRAVTAVMRKVVKALWHVAQGERFDSRKLFNIAEIAS